MKSILILTDFSDAAFHAAEYACALATQMQCEKVVLYHAYRSFVPTTDLPVSPVKDSGQLGRESLLLLEKLAERLQGKLPGDTEIILRTDDVVLPESLNEICRREGTELVAMGITGKSRLEKMLIGSTAIDVLKSSDYPVLLVPPAASIAAVKHIIFTTDLDDTAEDTPLPLLEQLFGSLQAQLWVLNVTPPDKGYDPETKNQLATLHALLDRFAPAYEFIDEHDVVRGIMGFAQQKDTSLIVMVHKDQGLFHSSITQKLAYRTLTPVITFRQR
ncbi:universal stress protein [Chitinophaga sp. XS-30]|uniref:universal stress protein n=1 Tax=Chitinophaga sp. XS-30 TaxID=2604421 RepID=UPI0011DCD7C2|nr:universal stress protein [Chitinophaga sp. XS-30]QEH42035.1 universal stress protein [Chitinophaga sp. XS-30]